MNSRTDSSPQKSLWEHSLALQETVRKLAESHVFMRRTLAAAVANSGGEIIVPQYITAMIALEPTILTWMDELHQLHIKVKRDGD